ncbi:MAG: MBL fold metallo-hydrolase [Candidatus Omnitrophica bacterium]|nr:MBL fold metallo-hydrolase [Candidatus Omnitrophota bacterium]MCM8811271.1 MBL fold metallo-hydrolase [Candidatus Omnitrophota bacterium]
MNSIKFLGTAGARFVMISQLRSSGGLWFSINGTQFLVDPGPGTLIRALKSRPKLNPISLDAIFLSHRHLDHSCEINLMIEAMTDGGFKKKGIVLAPYDCLYIDPVILIYCRNYVEKIEVLNEGKKYQVKNLIFEIPKKLMHSVETYGFKINTNNTVVSYIPDTSFFNDLIDFYSNSDILIINTVLYEKKENVQHLCLSETEEIIKNIKPKKAILTHFGMSMLKNKIWEKKEDISKRVGTEVIIANDGMNFEF